MSDAFQIPIQPLCQNFWSVAPQCLDLVCSGVYSRGDLWNWLTLRDTCYSTRLVELNLKFHSAGSNLGKTASFTKSEHCKYLKVTKIKQIIYTSLNYLKKRPLVFLFSAIFPSSLCVLSCGSITVRKTKKVISIMYRRTKNDLFWYRYSIITENSHWCIL